MNSAGYDCVVEVGEGLLNRSLSAAYTLADIAHLAGGRTGRFEYEVELQEPPTIQLLTGQRLAGGLVRPAPDRTIRVDLRAAIRLKALGFWFRFELIACAIGGLHYDPASHKLKLDARSITLSDIGIENQTGWLQVAFLRIDLPRVVLGWFNAALKEVIRAGLLDRYESLEVAAFRVDLPDMPAGDEHKLTIQIADARVLPHNVLGVAANLLGAAGGDAASLADFSGGRDLGVSLEEEALLRVFDFWWGRTTRSKKYAQHTVTTVHKLKDLDEFLSVVYAAGIDLDCLVDWDFEIEIGKPRVDLRSGNKVTITGWRLTTKATLVVRLRLRVKFNLLPAMQQAVLAGVMAANDWVWEGDLIRVTLVELDGAFDIKNVAAELVLDDEYRLVVNILKAEVDYAGETTWDACLEILVSLVGALLKKCRFPLSAGLVALDAEAGSIAIQLREPELTWDDSEVTLRARVAYTQIPKTTPSTPRFVAIPSAASPLRALIHRAGCPVAAKAAEREKLGYYTLFEAFQDGYSGCRACHTDIHGITLSPEPVPVGEALPVEPGAPIVHPR